MKKDGLTPKQISSEIYRSSKPILPVFLAVFFFIFNFYILVDYFLSPRLFDQMLKSRLIIDAAVLLIWWLSHKTKYAYAIIYFSIGFILSFHVTFISSITDLKELEVFYEFFGIVFIFAALLSYFPIWAFASFVIISNTIMAIGVYQRVNSFNQFFEVGFLNIALISLASIGFAWYNRQAQINRVKDRHIIRTRNTKIIKQNKDISDSRKDLEVLNSWKNKLISIIAHDFRAPLASIKSVLDILSENKLSESEIQEIRKSLINQLNYTNDLLNSLLIWTKSQMEGFAIKPLPFEANYIISQVLKVHSILAENKNIDLKLENATSFVIFSDPELCRLILRNMVNNAIKFTPDGGQIIIKTENHSDSKFGKIIVKDTGIGFDTSVLKQNQGSNIYPTLGTANEKGSGLGLKLAMDFMEKIGGMIEVKSILGEGTTIILYFPIINENTGIE